MAQPSTQVVEVDVHALRGLEIFAGKRFNAF